VDVSSSRGQAHQLDEPRALAFRFPGKPCVGSELGATWIDADHDIAKTSMGFFPSLEHERPLETRVRPAAQQSVDTASGARRQPCRRWLYDYTIEGTAAQSSAGSHQCDLRPQCSVKRLPVDSHSRTSRLRASSAPT
jgi:hypothetical protein